MIITISEIREQFDRWNGTIFNNELPTPTFELMHTKRLLGQFKWCKIGENKLGYTIRISTFYDRPLKLYVDTIVHEMLHYYIKYKGIKDTSSHGREWKSMAKKISREYGLNITRTSPIGGGVSKNVLEKAAEKKVAKFEYAIVCKMRDGHCGAAVVPSGKINSVVPRIAYWNAVREFKVVKAPWNLTYSLRHLRTAVGVRYITRKQYEELLECKDVRV